MHGVRKEDSFSKPLRSRYGDKIECFTGAGCHLTLCYSPYTFSKGFTKLLRNWMGYSQSLENSV